MDAFEQQIHVLQEKLRALDGRHDELQDRLRAVYRAQQEALEKEAGDIQVGDIVLVKETYGDARAGLLMRVVSCQVSEGRGDEAFLSVTLQFWEYGQITIPVACVIRVPDAQATVLWERLLEDARTLYTLVNTTLKRSGSLQ